MVSFTIIVLSPYLSDSGTKEVVFVVKPLSYVWFYVHTLQILSEFVNVMGSTRILTLIWCNFTYSSRLIEMSTIG